MFVDTPFFRPSIPLFYTSGDTFLVSKLERANFFALYVAIDVRYVYSDSIFVLHLLTSLDRQLAAMLVACTVEVAGSQTDNLRISPNQVLILTELSWPGHFKNYIQTIVGDVSDGDKLCTLLILVGTVSTVTLGIQLSWLKERRFNENDILLEGYISLVNVGSSIILKLLFYLLIISLQECHFTAFTKTKQTYHLRPSLLGYEPPPQLIVK